RARRASRSAGGAVAGRVVPRVEACEAMRQSLASWGAPGGAERVRSAAVGGARRGRGGVEGGGVEGCGGRAESGAIGSRVHHCAVVAAATLATQEELSARGCGARRSSKAGRARNQSKQGNA